MTPFDRAVKLFDGYSEWLGLGDYESLGQQCNFEDAFNKLICDVRGHDIGPDHCGKPEHDLCYRCQRLRVDIEKESQT